MPSPPVFRSATLFLTLAITLLPAAACHAQPTARASVASRPELEYLKAVNSAGPPSDPQLLFLLMSEYANANRAGEGAEFFSARLAAFGPHLTDTQRGLYLGAIGLLRARHAPAVPLLHRLGWMRATMATLDQAKRLSGGEVFIIQWIAGVVDAQLPSFLHRQHEAESELTWCLQHPDRAPHPGWLREVYRGLARIAVARGESERARELLRQSGYADLSTPIILTTPFAEGPQTGHRFSNRRIGEVVPGRVYALSGFDFTDLYFVVSADGRELVGIDAGTSAAAAKSAYEALRASAPGLPPLTTILVTHSHWDHIGGHHYFRSLTPSPRFYARSNYRQELLRVAGTPSTFAARFFGPQFKADEVRDFSPDTLIDGEEERTIGGTRFQFLPIDGGETTDALLINLPDEGIMFVGDFIMPYVGAPFVEEGNLDGLLRAIDVVVAKNPKRLLHGHEPLSRVFASPQVLSALEPNLQWLQTAVLDAISSGRERGEIHGANLIPPQLLSGDPAAHLPYLLMREHVIDRLYDQRGGYWHANLEGLDHLTSDDRGEILVDYLDLSDQQLARAAGRIMAAGKYELAASLLESVRGRFPESRPLAEARRLSYLKLMEKYQNTDPFKFILYSARIDQAIPSVDTPTLP